MSIKWNEQPPISCHFCYELMSAYLVAHVQLFETLCTVACQAPLSTGLSRQEY